ncbi:Methionine--tRNA ligase [bioreactor metagenome]|uniref:Methionine--tRNA ligase n=1 Tax=bioreactor metagenome TaxID=1076179 RepID=A0A645B6Y8_9ZZZZ
MKKELEELEAAMKEAQASSVANQTKKEIEVVEETVSEISIDDFDKIKLKVGTVIASEKMKGSKKLLKNQIKIGNETRQILSGIAPDYTPEEMVGKKVIVLTNLPPRKMMGEMSYGMILVAEDENGNLSLASVDKLDFADGAELS